MLVILCGKSASGKDRLKNELIKTGFMPIISTTSRPMREGEVNGKDYHFISKNEFLIDIMSQKFIEFRSYYTTVNGKGNIWYYGTSKKSIDSLDTTKDYLTILDLQGAQTLLDLYQSKMDILPIYIEVSDNIRKQRAQIRGSFDECEWERRCEDDNKAFSKENVAKTCKTNIIYNNGSDFTECLEQFYNICKKKLPILGQ